MDNITTFTREDFPLATKPHHLDNTGRDLDCGIIFKKSIIHDNGIKENLLIEFLFDEILEPDNLELLKYWSDIKRTDGVTEEWLELSEKVSDLLIRALRRAKNWTNTKNTYFTMGKGDKK
jgi:hypothetical protein